MEIKSISYSDSREYIEYGLKRWKKAGIEIELSENDTPEEGYKYAKEQVEKTLTPVVPVQENPLPSKTTIPLSKEQKEKQRVDDMIANIEKCETIESLDDYKNWVHNAAIKSAIDLRRLQLKKS